MEKVSVEVATSEFEKFAECMDLDLDERDMTGEEKVDFGQLKSQFIRGVQTGHITMNEAGEPTVVFKLPPEGQPTSITFYEPDGAAFLALDKGKKNADISKRYMMMAEICKCQPSLFGKLKNRDLKICQMIIALFLA
jgi:hypothetical protein